MFINNFDPVAFEILSFEIRWYSLSYIFGIIFGWIYAKKFLIKDENINKYDLVESKGVKVFIEPAAAMFLIGSEMDYSTDKLSSRFIFNNPNEKSSCGCGESFNV